jgi:hypothetical protein
VLAVLPVLPPHAVVTEAIIATARMLESTFFTVGFPPEFSKNFFILELLLFFLTFYL